MTDNLASAVGNGLISGSELDRDGAPANVVDGLFAIARALDNLATQVKYLGNGDASTTVGAIEGFGMHIGEKLDNLTTEVRYLRGIGE